jgi:energy-coupling factor transporter ATP-binding protein EcfA2
VGSSLSELQKEVSIRIRITESAAKASRELGMQLKSLASASEEEIEIRLIQAHEFVIRLRTALEREQEDEQTLERERKVTRDASDEIAGLRVKLKRVESAYAVIKDLLSKQSDQILADQVLRENAGTIASTFAKIHAPNEFDVVVGEGLRIVRRVGGSSVELVEMSSGQRAAYALSLFLAMNERLRTGPKILIFDDPVSHVDDINTLSFLDHLRDIALTGKRQIFFATADTKLASVMSRLKPPVALEADPSDHRWWEGVTWGSRNTSFG